MSDLRGTQAADPVSAGTRSHAIDDQPEECQPVFDYFTHLKYSDPQLWALFRHWPIAIFLPSILVLLACLALVTRMWDERERGSSEDPREEIDGD